MKFGTGKLTFSLAVVKPGNPLYLEYVRSTVEQKRRRYDECQGSEPRGNPNLVYESKFVEGWEPSGVPVSLLPPSITRLLLRRVG